MLTLLWLPRPHLSTGVNSSHTAQDSSCVVDRGTRKVTYTASWPGSGDFVTAIKMSSAVNGAVAASSSSVKGKPHLSHLPREALDAIFEYVRKPKENDKCMTSR